MSLHDTAANTTNGIDSLYYRSEPYGESALPEGMQEVVLDALRAALQPHSGATSEVSISRTFVRKGYLNAGNPIGDRNRSYSQGEQDGYLISVAVHFEPGHSDLPHDQLDATLAVERDKHARARIEEINRQIAETDAARSVLAAELAAAEASLTAAAT